MSPTSSNINLESFADKLLQEKKLENISAEVREQMREDLVDRLEERVNLALVQFMPPEKLDEFEQLVSSKNLEDIAKFCAENIPNLEQIIASELLNFRTTYLMTG